MKVHCLSSKVIREYDLYEKTGVQLLQIELTLRHPPRENIVLTFLGSIKKNFFWTLLSLLPNLTLRGHHVEKPFIVFFQCDKSTVVSRILASIFCEKRLASVITRDI